MMNCKRSLPCFAFFLLLILALSACSQIDSTDTTDTAETTETEGISLEEATQIVLDDVLSLDTLDHELIVFAWPLPLVQSDELISYSPPAYEPIPERIELPANAWFFWVDDAPGARFAHPSRFVVVDRADGKVTLQDSEWWPVLNGADLWIESDAYWNEDDWVFTNIEWRPSSSLPQDNQTASVYEVLNISKVPLKGKSAQQGLLQADSLGAVVVINGGDKKSSLQNEQFAIDSQNILGLFGPDMGFERTYLGPEIEIEGEVNTGTNDLDSIGDVLEQKAEDLKPGQTLFVYITGHGFVTEDDEGFAAGISEFLLRIWLSDIDPGVKLILVIDTCYSGSFVKTTRKYADITITSTGPQDSAYSDLDKPEDPNPEDKGGEYTSGFVEDWRELSTASEEAERVRALSISRGQNIWETLASQSHLSAVQKDVAFLTGKTFPQLVPGLPQTKATNEVQLDHVTDPPNDSTACGSDTPLFSNADIIGAWMGVDPSDHGSAFIEVEFDHGAPLEDFSFATLATITDALGKDTKYLWEVHNDDFVIGQVDPITLELLPPDQQEGIIDVLNGSNVILEFPFFEQDEITLIPLLTPLIITIDSFNTAESTSGLACDSLIIDPFFIPPASSINDSIDEQFAHISQVHFFAYPTGKLSGPREEDTLEVQDDVLIVDALASGNQVSHSDGQQMKAAIGATDITGIDTFQAEVDDSVIPELFTNTDYPCGPGEYGFTVCGQASFPAGRAFVIGVTYDDDIAIQDPLNIYQYGFVFDSDGDTENNYEASDRFPNDFFDGTDLFYVLAYTPETGWELTSTDVRGERRDIATGARAIINNNTIVVMIPASEIDLVQPSYRLTAFRHTGDFGLNPPNDWDADVVPPVDQPLIQIGEQLVKISVEDGPRELGRLEDLSRIQSFYASYNQAFADQNTDFLFDSLHPAVFELYGQEACRSYLDGIVANTISVEALELNRHGAWIYDRDSANILIQNSYTAQVTVTLPDASTLTQTTHLGLLADGTITWFTDCGDPLP